jgi:Icc protein
MLIGQISDTHISTAGSRNDRFFHTAELLARAVAHLNGLETRPDLVVITGDLVEHGQVEEYERLRKILGPLAMPTFLIPGNHDDRGNLRKVFAHHAYLFSDGRFVQYAVEDWPVRLLALDTLVPGQSGGRLCGQRLAWLEARLAEAPRRPTVVIMHHPPFVTGIAAMDDMGLDGTEAMADVIQRHPQVERVLCGHLHRTIVRRFGGTVACTCPSTGHQIALDLPPAQGLAAVMEPPACMLHLWLGDAGGLVSHVSLIGDGHPRFTVYDGQRWFSDAVPPPGFFRGP